MAKINCIGVLVVDALSGPLDRYPAPKVDPQVVTKSVRFTPGGGAANTTSALGRMGLSVAAFSKVGDDPNGEFVRRELAAVGVDTTNIRVSPDDATPFTFVGVHPGGERSFIHTPGANLTFCTDDLDVDRLMDADLLLFQDVWVLPRLEGRPGAELLAQARRKGIVTLLDECWGLGPSLATLAAMLPHCDYVLPSLEDMKAIFPRASVGQIADELLRLGAGAAVLKMGPEGCLVARGGDRIVVPAFPTNVVDTTGAGDCWDAGFLAGLANGQDIFRSARLGNACASFCIQAIGGATGVPDFATVQAKAGD